MRSTTRAATGHTLTWTPGCAPHAHACASHAAGPRYCLPNMLGACAVAGSACGACWRGRPGQVRSGQGLHACMHAGCVVARGQLAHRLVPRQLHRGHHEEPRPVSDPASTRHANRLPRARAPWHGCPCAAAVQQLLRCRSLWQGRQFHLLASRHAHSALRRYASHAFGHMQLMPRARRLCLPRAAMAPSGWPPRWCS